MIRCDYRLSSSGLQVRRWCGDEGPSRHHFTLRKDALLFPLMRTYTGAIIRHLQINGPADIVVPCIDSDLEDEMLMPTVSRRRADFSNARWPSGMKQPDHSACFSYLGGRYDEDSQFWIDESDLLVRYLWEQGEDKRWDVRCIEG